MHITGVAGYTWVGILHILLGFSFKTTLLIANTTALGWLAVYYILLQPQVVHFCPIKTSNVQPSVLGILLEFLTWENATLNACMHDHDMCMAAVSRRG